MFGDWRARAAESDGDDERTVAVPGKPAAFADEDAVEYRTTIEDPRTGDDEIAVLELRGLFAHATVEIDAPGLDGEAPVTAEHDAYFEPLRLPFEPTSDTQLRVTCRAPEDRFGGLYDTDLLPESECAPGIWWGASVEGRPLPAVDRVRVRPEITDDGAVVRAHTTVLTDGPLDDRITYSVKPAGDHAARGMMNRGAVEADGAGATTATHDVEVRDPALWWPRDLGDQHRYSLRAKLNDTEATATTGICEIDRADGHLVVNGQRCPIRGVNLLGATADDVDLAREVNANLLRAYAHAPPQSVYEAAAEAGVLVWQDLPLTGPGAFDVDRGRALARALDRTYGSYPNLSAVAVHDRPVDLTGDGLGGGFLDRMRLRWRAWRSSYDAEPAESVAEDCPDGRPVFPVVGGPGVGSDAGAYFPGWEVGDPDDLEALLSRYPADVVAAYGAGSITEKYEGSAAGFDADLHDGHVEENADDAVAGSQAYQARVLREVTDALRLSGRGAVAFALRDTDSAGMGVYDVGGWPKESREVLVDAFRPVQTVLADPEAGETAVAVVNDSGSAVSGTLRWSAGDADGEREVSVGAGERWTGDAIDVPDDADAVTCRLQVGEDVIERTYDR